MSSCSTWTEPHPRRGGGNSRSDARKSPVSEGMTPSSTSRSRRFLYVFLLASALASFRLDPRSDRRSDHALEGLGPPFANGMMRERATTCVRCEKLWETVKSARRFLRAHERASRVRRISCSSRRELPNSSVFLRDSKISTSYDFSRMGLFLVFL